MISRETERKFLTEHGYDYRVATIMAYGYDPGPNAEPEDEEEDSFYDDSEELGGFLDPDYEEYFERCMERD